MAEQFANQATSTLSTSVSAGATTLAVKSASKFPSEGDFRIVVGSEIMLVTGVSSKTFAVKRGQEGTTATTHASGDTVAHVLTAGALASKADQSALEIVNLGTDWSDGERRFGYSSDNPAALKAEINQGTKAAPDTGSRPPVTISRVLSTPESSFAGDGEGSLAAIRVTTVAVEGSEGQAIGIAASAVTESSHEGAHSLADGIAGTFVGISRKGTRTGMGAFFDGRRETSSGRATGIEVSVDNAVEGASESYAGTLPGTKAIHVHAFGASNSAIGMILGKPSTASMHTGIGAVDGSVTDAFLRDDSKALRSLLIRGAHEKAAIAVASGAGPVVIGAEALSGAGPSLEVYTGEANADPAVRIGTGKAFASSLELKSEAGNCKLFVSASTNGFLNESGNGGTGIQFGASKIFSIGRAGGVRGMLRINEGGVAIGEGAASSFGGGKGVMFLANASAAPSSNPTGGGILYCEAGSLKYRGSSGTVTTVGVA